MLNISASNSIKPNRTMNQGIVTKSVPVVGKTCTWTSTKAYKADIQLKEAKSFFASLKELAEQIKPLAGSTIEEKNNWWHSVVSDVKAVLNDEWEYLISKQYKKDAQKQDCIHNKALSHATALMSEDVYNKEQMVIDGFEPIEKIEDNETGLKAVSYKRNKDIVIAYCGTNDKNDFKSDAQMAAGKIPEQFEEANNYYESIVKKNPDCAVILTGHSLGGSLAELVASKNKRGVAITFNAYGVANLVKSNSNANFVLNDNKNSFNYIIEGDPVSNSSKHVGETTLLTKTALNNHSVANYISMWG